MTADTLIAAHCCIDARMHTTRDEDDLTLSEAADVVERLMRHPTTAGWVAMHSALLDAGHDNCHALLLALRPCDGGDGCSFGPVLPYLLIDHEGDPALAFYCPDCTDLARADWNGNVSRLALIDAASCITCSVSMGSVQSKAECGGMHA